MCIKAHNRRHEMTTNKELINAFCQAGRTTIIQERINTDGSIKEFKKVLKTKCLNARDGILYDHNDGYAMLQRLQLAQNTYFLLNTSDAWMQDVYTIANGYTPEQIASPQKGRWTKGHRFYCRTIANKYGTVVYIDGINPSVATVELLIYNSRN